MKIKKGDHVIVIAGKDVGREGTVILADPERQRENLAIFDFELTGDEMASITGLGRPDGRIRGQDPAVYEEF